MSGNLHEISVAIGEIRQSIKNIEANTAGHKEEVSAVSKRVKSLEIKEAYNRGVDSQNKKIAAAAGTVGGGIISILIGFVKSKGWLN